MKNLKIILLSLIILLNKFSIADKKIKKDINLKYENKEKYITTDIPFYDSKNNKIYFDKLEGQTLLVVFWATWCAPCKKEIKDLDILAKDFRKLNIKIIIISEDYTGIETVEKFFKENEIRYLEPYLDSQNALFKDLEIIGLPTSFIISPDGKIEAAITGDPDWNSSDLRKILLDFIPGNPSMPKNSFKDNSLNQVIKDVTIDLDKQLINEAGQIKSDNNIPKNSENNQIKKDLNNKKPDPKEKINPENENPKAKIND